MRDVRRIEENAMLGLVKVLNILEKNCFDCNDDCEICWVSEKQTEVVGAMSVIDDLFELKDDEFLRKFDGASKFDAISRTEYQDIESLLLQGLTIGEVKAIGDYENRHWTVNQIIQVDKNLEVAHVL